MIIKSDRTKRWAACPEGGLQQLVDELHARRRREFLKRLASTATVVVALGAGGYVAAGWLRQAMEYRYGGLTCSEVRRLAADYHAKRLDLETTRKMTIHLKKCPRCGPDYREKYGELVG